MLNFLAQHWGSILIGAIIVIVVALVIVKMYRDHKKGQVLLRLRMQQLSFRRHVPQRQVVLHGVFTGVARYFTALRLFHDMGQ